MKNKKMGLPMMIFIAMVAGILVGLCFLGNPDITTNYIKPIGTIFINLLKFIVVPIVLLSLICGMISMKDIRKVGSIGWKTLVYYMFTTLVAIIIGLGVANVFKGVFPLLDTTGAQYAANSSNFMDTLVNIFPSNLWQPLLNANMLQVIVIAIMFGAGILLVDEQKAAPTVALVESLNEIVMKVMMFIINCSPIGVFCLMVNVVAVNGPSIVGSLAIVLAIAYVAYALHLIIVYSVAVKAAADMSPMDFFKGMVPAMIFAFTSTSSVATLPLTKECSDNMGANPEYSSFILPLGATINMDGTAIYMGVATIFIATCYGVTLTLSQMLAVVLTATLASIGTAGVSGAGMIMLAMVLEAVGLPVEGIALIYGVDKIFDMGRTTLNIVGDASCAVVVSKIEEKRAAKAKAA